MQVPSIFTSGLSSALQAFGMPAPVAQITMSLAPKMMNGEVTTPQIIAAIMAFALSQAKKAIADDKRKKYPQAKGVWWIGLYEAEGEVHAVPMLQNFQNHKKGVMTGAGIFIDKESTTNLKPFMIAELKKLGETIKPKDLQTQYKPILDFLKNSQFVAIDDETVDYILHLVTSIFENPEPFLDVIFEAMAGNMAQLFKEANGKYGGTLSNMTIYASENHTGLSILIEGDSFVSILDIKDKKRQYTPAEEILELVLQANEGYYEENFKGIISDLPAPNTTPAPQTENAHGNLPTKEEDMPKKPAIKKKSYKPLVLSKLMS